MDNKIITCPKCGHENLFPSEECSKCGSTFSLFPELRPLFVKEKQGGLEEMEGIFETDDQKEKLICPKCGQANDSWSVECSKCGVVFAKYYEIQARYETNKGKKAQLLRKKHQYSSGHP